MEPQQIGRYQIKSELGRGGMATVFGARDPRFERDVAIKVLPREFLHDPTFRARFEREAKIIAALEHSAIVPVYDFGDDDGQPYLVMRYMPGGSLADRLRTGPLPLPEAIKVLQRIGSALDTAHRRGIIHRDLKPGNILFDQYGDPYLADFGIVKLTQQTAATLSTGGVIGTPAYMSPEQAKGEADLDGRSDIYALGAILFEMLTGQQPYQADTPMGLAVKHITEPVPRILDYNPNLPDGCSAVIAKAMAKERTDRFDLASELAITLESSNITGASAAQASQGEQDAPVDLISADSADATLLSRSGSILPGMTNRQRWRTVGWLALVWALSLIIGGTLGGNSPAGGLPAGLLGGLGTGLVLRRRLALELSRWHLVAIAGGWLVGFALIFAGIAAGNGLGAVVGIAIGGGVNGFTVRRVVPSLTKKQIWLAVGGWFIALSVATTVGVVLGGLLAGGALIIAGALFGAIGGRVVVWQLTR